MPRNTINEKHLYPMLVTENTKLDHNPIINLSFEVQSFQEKEDHKSFFAQETLRSTCSHHYFHKFLDVLLEGQLTTE